MRTKEREQVETPSTDLDCNNKIDKCNEDRIPPTINLTVASFWFILF